MLIKICLVFLLLATPINAIEAPLFGRLNFDDTPDYSVTTQNVGQGSCTVVKNHANNKALVVDAGSSSAGPAHKKTNLSGLFGFSEENPDIPFQDDSVTAMCLTQTKIILIFLKFYLV